MQLDKKQLTKERLNKSVLLIYNSDQDIHFSADELEKVMSDPNCEKFVNDSLQVKQTLNKLELKPRSKTIKNIMEFAMKANDEDNSN
ncbi:hypothetical protein KMW28_00530 [Flammeovirga yaeyamensis]|uniref:Uncharacterized protein n=1 Tax=Flammeovirga yaeyamensis TaxID=367791 RepID=A0AAX1N788_9BACT|nr:MULTISPECIES: hypothetical protein [Flammeovirga]ANQ50472.1 hypothetical protein MY04_3107 [Flammeovirga sp. MY04]MBB3700686.1 hypothetical protein [Flammeovirga yaeyamensis]NMF37798.1 hypothetical protein [Flammeovirga yaeyamensis]QWG02105.1 hypothetical protein KMW28_00530 [Flammeovirga yaeyamensis]